MTKKEKNEIYTEFYGFNKAHKIKQDLAIKQQKSAGLSKKSTDEDCKLNNPKAVK